MNEAFIPALIPPDNFAAPAAWFLFHGFDLLVFLDEQGGARVPEMVSPSAIDLGDFRVVHQQYFGYLPQKSKLHCYAAELVADKESPKLPDDLALMNLRRLYGRLDESFLWLAGRAVQLVDWDRTHQFCGRCGAATHTDTHERVKKCANCAHTSYPRISPAVIVQVTRAGENGREILLARGKRFKIPMYSVLAGFVEPGETLEMCVRREIREEVGLEVKNIRYFGSQPWPFPNSLMVAFTAEYASGDIVLEEEELIDAQWFHADDLPLYPPPMSIANHLIEDFKKAS
jgi:NAD+ diphosphatase